MKLSEAIILGSIHTPQAYGVFYRASDGATCALGAALDAVGKLEKIEGMVNHNIHDREWPWASGEGIRVHCPVQGCSDHKHWARSIIAHLNNDHKWTRPRIAAWVATVEPQDIVTEPITEEVYIEVERSMPTR